MLKIIFIIGANGVGKTSLMNELAKMLSKKDFELHDFDERGVPDNADKSWRKKETLHWISIGNANKLKGLSTIIFGFVKPEEIEDDNIQIILLDASEKTLKERLLKRYLTNESIAELYRATSKTVEKFIEDNLYVLPILRQSCENRKCEIISTSDKIPLDIANEIVKKL